jgi:hypothetical protein
MLNSPRNWTRGTRSRRYQRRPECTDANRSDAVETALLGRLGAVKSRQPEMRHPTMKAARRMDGPDHGKRLQFRMLPGTTSFRESTPHTLIRPTNGVLMGVFGLSSKKEESWSF